jgi:hypothetical protein
MRFRTIFIKHDCPDPQTSMKRANVISYIHRPTFSRMRRSSEGRRFEPRLSLLIFATRIRFSFVTLYSARVQEVWNKTQKTLRNNYLRTLLKHIVSQDDLGWHSCNNVVCDVVRRKLWNVSALKRIRLSNLAPNNVLL